MVRNTLAYGYESSKNEMGQQASSDEKADTKNSSSKCPFSGMVETAFSDSRNQIRWTDQAEERLNRIPDMVRPMVKKSIEQYAQEKGYAEITISIMEEVKGGMGF